MPELGMTTSQSYLMLELRDDLLWSYVLLLKLHEPEFQAQIV